jgi:hypothetical protein
MHTRYGIRIGARLAACGSRRVVYIALALSLGLLIGSGPGRSCLNSAGSAADTGYGMFCATPAFGGEAAKFVTLPPGSPLPSGAQCAARVRRSSWEARPENSAANHRFPSADELARMHSSVRNGGVPTRFFARVDGNFSGTTDEIIQWGACKWGFDEDLVRAIATDESHWRQADVGDWTTDTSFCPPGTISGNGCYQSYGLLQIKHRSFPGTWPMSRESTAFNVDYKLAYQRACMEGGNEWLRKDVPLPGFPSYPNGSGEQMLWGCVGDWYSGEWYDAKALTYIQRVREELAKRGWRNYQD